jgi:oligopeptide/dipeptide ABC transporter ATP-binding protein
VTAVLEVSGLVKEFKSRGGLMRAVDDVSFAVGEGETLAIVGESGSGKTTTALCSLLLERPTSGTVFFDGEPMGSGNHRSTLRRNAQFVFQDPASSLNPRLRVGDIVREPLDIHGFGDKRARQLRVRELLERVGLPADAMDRKPGEFSGGQRQRIGIARALALEPKLIVFDEPVSALDVSIQAQIINLLSELQRDLGTAFLAVVRYLAARIAVMYLGTIVEIGRRDALFGAPRHPYTEALISAAPSPVADHTRRRVVLTGEPPSPFDRPAGCPFASRCPRVDARCRHERPALIAADQTSPEHFVACHYPNDPRGVSLVSQP